MIGRILCYQPRHPPRVRTKVPVADELQGLGSKDLGARGVAVAGHVDEVQTHLAVAIPGAAGAGGWAGGCSGLVGVVGVSCCESLGWMNECGAKVNWEIL